MVAVLIGVGELIVHAGALGGLRQWDDDVTSWMADHRTAFLDGLTGFLTRTADTMGVVADRARRRDRARGAAAMVGIADRPDRTRARAGSRSSPSTAIVGRPRPDVPKLGSEPSTSSFPSGHIAATVVLWGAVALLFCSASTYRWVRATAYTIVVVLGVAVGTARACTAACTIPPTSSSEA